MVMVTSYQKRRRTDACDPAVRGLALRRIGALTIVSVIAGGSVAVAAWGILSRHSHVADLQRATGDLATPSVELCVPTISNAMQGLVLPANIEAFTEAPIYARVSGYLKSWTYDIGAAVKAGDILGLIEAPDLHEQVEQARSLVARSEAEEVLARATAQRWSILRDKAVVSLQSADEKIGNLEAATASLSAAKANFGRLDSLRSFLQLTAPFDGVVISRNIDVGALIDAGVGQRELFRVADIHRVRVYVQVPQFYAAKVHVGVTGHLTVPQYPAREFATELVATSKAIAANSRTLLAQFQGDNSDGTLLPGGFGQMRIDLPAEGAPLLVPASALVFVNSAPQVATLDDAGVVHMKTVKIIRDLGTGLEISAGLSMTDRVIKTPWQSIHEGVVVKVKNDNRKIYDGLVKECIGN